MEITAKYHDINNPLPNIFELVAKDSFRGSLRTLFRLGMGFVADRIAFFHFILHRSDDIFGGLMGLLDIAYLREYDATVVEHFLGYRRTEAPMKPISSLAEEKAESERVRGALSVKGVRSSVIEVIAVMICQKIKRMAEARLQNPSSQKSTLARIILEHIAPYINAVISLGKLYLTVLYSMGRSTSVTLPMKVQNLMLVHANKYDATRYDTKRLTTRLRNLIIVIAVCLKVCEWYFGNAQEVEEVSRTKTQARKETHAEFAIPPPPDVLENTPVINGECPICKRKITNLTLNAASGKVFCYPCIKNHVDSTGRCPVTNIATDASQLRRMFLNA